MQQGVTLLELLITISIMAIVATAATPAYSSLMETQRQELVREQLLAAIASAKGEARRLSQTVYLCASPDGQLCGSDWGAGWIIYADKDRDQGLSAGDSVLLAQHLSSARPITAGGDVAVRFLPNGLVSAVTFNLCSAKLSDISQTIEISPLGRVSLGDASAADC